MSGIQTALYLYKKHLALSWMKNGGKWNGLGTFRYFSHGRENARGVAFLFHRNNDFEVEMVYSGEEERMLILEIKSDTHEMTLAGVYAPSISGQEDKCNFLNRVDRQLHVNPTATWSCVET